MSLLQIIPEKINREKLILRIINEINRYFDLLNEGEVELIISRWKENSSILGKRVVIQKGDTRITGKSVDINLHGNLLLENEDKKIVEIDSGQILSIPDD